MGVRGLEPGRRPALVLVECQNSATNPAFSNTEGLASQCQARGMVEHIAVLADECRAAGIPVFYSLIVHRPDFSGCAVNCALLGANRKHGRAVEGDASVEVNPRITPRPGDFVVTRHHGVTSFYGTELDALLRNLGTETVILAASRPTWAYRARRLRR